MKFSITQYALFLNLFILDGQLSVYTSFFSFFKMANNVVVFLCSIVFIIAIMPVKTYGMIQENDDCPLWYQSHESTGTCVCGSSLNGVIN